MKAVKSTNALKHLYLILLPLVFLTTVHAEVDIDTASTQYGSTMYLLNDNPAEVIRYDLSADEFLAPISLADTPMSLAVDDSGIYVGTQNKTIYRFDLNGDNESNIAIIDADISESKFELAANGQFLFVLTRNPDSSDYPFPVIHTLNKTTGVIIHTKRIGFPSFSSAAQIEISNDYLFSISNNTLISNLVSESGELGDQVPALNRSLRSNFGPGLIHIIPEDSILVDSRGYLYSLPDIDYLGTLGVAHVQDLAWSDNQYFVLGFDALTVHDSDFMRTGKAIFENNVRTIAVTDSDVLGFYIDDAGAAGVEKLKIDEIGETALPLPAQADWAFSSGYIPAITRNSESILLYSFEDISNQFDLYEYTLATDELNAIYSFSEKPVSMAYSNHDDHLYVSYQFGRISSLDLSNGVETTFANVADESLALVSAGDKIVSFEDTANAITVFSDVGDKLSERLDIYSPGFDIRRTSPNNTFKWSPLNSKIIQSNTGSHRLRSFEMTNNGNIGVIDVSPDQSFEDSFKFRSSLFQLSNDESSLLFNSGEIISVVGFELLHLLSEPDDFNNYNFAATPYWTADGGIIGTQSVEYDSATQVGNNLVQWNSDFEEIKRLPIQQFLHRLIRVGEDIYFIGTQVVPNPPGQAGPDRTGLVIFKLYDSNDTDGDGVSDSEEPYPVNPLETIDTDNDGIGDNRDRDDDNDGAADLNEDLFPLDPTRSGDTDGDGIENADDDDDDGDGRLDQGDAFPLDPSEQFDADEDGVGDNADLDDDNDGALDNNEDLYPSDPTRSGDTDEDGIENAVDDDDDGDGIPDQWERDNSLNPLDSADAGQDTDGDGTSNLTEFQNGTNPNVSDSNGNDSGAGSDSGGGGGVLSWFFGILLLLVVVQRRKVVVY